VAGPTHRGRDFHRCELARPEGTAGVAVADRRRRRRSRRPTPGRIRHRCRIPSSVPFRSPTLESQTDGVADAPIVASTPTRRGAPGFGYGDAAEFVAGLAPTLKTKTSGLTSAGAAGASSSARGSWPWRGRLPRTRNESFRAFIIYDPCSRHTLSGHEDPSDRARKWLAPRSSDKRAAPS